MAWHLRPIERFLFRIDERRQAYNVGWTENAPEALTQDMALRIKALEERVDRLDSRTLGSAS